MHSSPTQRSMARKYRFSLPAAPSLPQEIQFISRKHLRHAVIWMTDLVHNKLPENINRFVIAYILIYWKCHPSLCPLFSKPTCAKCAGSVSYHTSWSARPFHTCESDGTVPPAAKARSQSEPWKPGTGRTRWFQTAGDFYTLSPRGYWGDVWGQFWSLQLRATLASSEWEPGRRPNVSLVEQDKATIIHCQASKGQCRGRETESSSPHVAVTPSVWWLAEVSKWGCLTEKQGESHLMHLTALGSS